MFKARILSVIMAIALVVSCVPVISLGTFAQEADAVYYISGGATGNGTSPETPAGTMSALVAQIEKDGFNISGKEVIVKLMNGSARFAYNSEAGAYKVVPHNATLIFERYDKNTTANLWATNHNTDGVRSDYSYLRLGGPTVMRDISLSWQVTNADWRQHYANGHNWTLENVTFRAYDNSLFTTENDVISLGYRGGDNAFHVGGGTGGTLSIDEATIKNHKWGYLDFAGNRSTETYNEDVKLFVGSANFPSGIRLSGGANAKFNKNANIVLNGTTVNGISISGSGSVTIANGHALQIIYNNGATITGPDAAKNLTRYDIFVENIEGGSLDTTDTAGTYEVTLPEGKEYAVATDANGTKYTSNNNILTVGDPGVYNVTFEDRDEGRLYYISGGATGNGTSPETPAGTLSALVAQLEKDGVNVAGKEIIVKVISNGSTYFYYNTENNAKSTVPYKATLVFESMDAENQSVIGVTSSSVTTRGDQHLRISGPTKFKNIGIAFYRGYSDWMETYCGGYDVSFENVQFYGYKSDSDKSLTVPTTTNNNRIIVQGSIDGLVDGEGGTITVDAATISKNTLGYASLSSGVSTSYTDQLTMENDVKMVLGKGTLNNELRIGGAANGASIAYKKNINIILNGTTTPLLYSRNKIANMTDGHAMQIIYNNGASISTETTGTYAFTNLTRYDIFVENIEGASLDTTYVAGTYEVTYPADKSIVYFYAVNASGNYDGTTPVHYATAETISVGAAGKYKVGFASSVSDINVEIVNDYAQFEGWINNEAEGTLTPVEAASNITDTDVSTIDGTVIYTADITAGSTKKTIITATGNSGETNALIEFSNGGLDIAGFSVAGEFEYGTYGVKLTLAPEASAVFAEVTKPDGTVIRRGNSLMLAGNTSFDKITVKSTSADAVANAKAVKGNFTPDNYTINETAPTLSDFEQNVYNIVTSYNADAKTTRNFAFTVKANYLSDDETLVVEYNVKGSDEKFVADAVKKEEKTVYSDVDFYEVNITGLTAGTTYEYTIGKNDGSDHSNTYSFTTEAQDEEGFSFIAISDTQGTVWNGYRGFMYTQSAINEALEDVKNPAFILNAGDVVEGNSSDVGKDTALEVMWKNYFMALGDTVKSVPHFSAMGNHDYHGHGESSNGDFLFNLHFNHPDNGGKTAIPMWSNMGNYVTNVMNNPTESAYSFDYDNAHFTVINSGPSGGTDKWLLGAQKTWLTNDITNSDAQWKIVVVHQPAYDAAGTSEVFSYYEINTLMEDLGVDLVIQGHAHYNTRTYPMKNGEAVRTTGNPDTIEKGEGTVYSIIGSTATDHDVLKDDLNENYVSVFSPASEMPVYAVVDVADDTLTYTVKQLDGFVVDSFTIEKDTSYRTPEKIGVQIRIPDENNADIKQGLRFVSSVSRETFDELAAREMLPKTSKDEGIGYGSVIIPENLLPAGEKLTKKTTKAVTIPSVKIHSIDENEVIFTACLVGILENNYTRRYCVVPYVTVKNGDEEITYYGEMQTASVYEIALLACAENSKESEYTKAYLKTKVIDVVEAN